MANSPMHYVLAPYVGRGTDTDPFRPRGADDAPSWASIDLRPDGSRVDGFALVAAAAPPRDSRLLHLGDDPHARSSRVRRLLGNRLGLTLASDRFANTVADLMLQHSREDGTRWHPLHPAGPRYEIWLGGLLWSMPILAGGSTFAESFNTADSTTLGPDLTWAEPVGDLEIVGNQVQCVSAASQSGARAEHDVATSNMYAQLRVVALEPGTAALSFVEPCCRYSSSARTFYLSRAARDNGQDVRQLSRRVAGAITLITADTVLVSAGAILRVEAQGSTVRYVVDGLTVLSATDTNIAAGTRGGIEMRGQDAVGEAIVDAFEMGDLGVFSRVTPVGVSMIPTPPSLII